jgi:hypothetical protein
VERGATIARRSARRCAPRSRIILLLILLLFLPSAMQAPHRFEDKVILHVDMDGFYAQVEHRRTGIPRDQPLGVQQWASLIAVNYPAKAAGVKRGMRAEEALKVCPGIHLVEVEVISGSSVDKDRAGADAGQGADDGDDAADGETTREGGKVSLERYRQASREVFEALQTLGCVVEKASIDEAFLDVTDLVSDLWRAARRESVHAAHPGGAGALDADDADEQEDEGDDEYRPGALQARPPSPPCAPARVASARLRPRPLNAGFRFSPAGRTARRRHGAARAPPLRPARPPRPSRRAARRPPRRHAVSPRGALQVCARHDRVVRVRRARRGVRSGRAAGDRRGSLCARARGGAGAHGVHMLGWRESQQAAVQARVRTEQAGQAGAPRARMRRAFCEGGTRRVQLVREEGRDVSS